MGATMEEWLWFWGIACIIGFALYYWGEQEGGAAEVVTGILAFLSLAMFVPVAFIKGFPLLVSLWA